ncbi:MFS family permease [Rhodoligotrophos appendicifer]|uniref:MFS transporter n=1 Tax=Rhodoligotrophos appendicifer TaxID=987056 RepID=UPI0011848CC1|nr:MFS transporter [Rhodoligotrophos appendicifer]
MAASGIDWRNLIAACATVSVFSFSLGEMYPLLSLKMESWGTPADVIGINSAMAPVGILVAGMFIPKLAHAFGAKRLAICMVLVTAAVILAYPTFPSVLAWFPLRLLQGMAVAALFALSESWVLSYAHGKYRGRIVGIYATCISATFGLGAAVVSWAGIDGYLPFVIGSAVLLMAIIPMGMVAEPPRHSDDSQVSIVAFARKAPLLVLAIGIHAVFDGGMLGFLSIYGVRMGLDLNTAALALTVLAFGNVFFQVPIGWIADHTSRRGMMLTCFATAAISLALLPALINTVLLWPLVLIMGASGFGIYTLGLAILGDEFTGPDLIAGTATFAAVWGLGSLVGSVLVGFAIALFGPNGFPAVLVIIFLGYLGIQAALTSRNARQHS